MTLPKLPPMPLDVDDYLSATEHLTAAEHGAYLLILMQMWRRRGIVPADDRTLAGLTHLTMSNWRRMRQTIMAFMQPEQGGKFISQRRVLLNLDQVSLHSKVQSARAKARWLKYKGAHDAVAEPWQSRGSAQPMPLKEEEDRISSSESVAARENKTNGAADTAPQQEEGRREEPKPNGLSKMPDLTPSTALLNTRLFRK